MNLPVLIIEPRPGWRGIDWRELWRHRELLWLLTWRDVKVKYKQAALGAAWAIIQPFMTMVVFTIFFGRLAGLEARTGGLPYPIFVYAGLLPWTFFANALASSGNSVVGGQNLITKVYFPRLLIPIASLGAGLVDFAIAFVILIGMMFWYSVCPGLAVVMLPLVALFIAMAALGIGTTLAALMVTYRDIRHIIPFLVQIWLFVTPVIYPTNLLPERWQWVLALNPMSGLIETFRFALLGQAAEWNPLHFGISCAATIIMFVVGVFCFRRLERKFADIV